ncbi:MAG: hypothetical protein COV47_04090 [Candidatus Diapherotrites archaeon CG11_big_fil_rev_8_21_14_0_20_37_9]|nr:MAG: hypothetical protein COV47_04090 [Candidatus Diapherotrites archaeon CG11_big_fil_rev_8_21_14_0_20_37_9]
MHQGHSEGRKLDRENAKQRRKENRGGAMAHARPKISEKEFHKKVAELVNKGHHPTEATRIIAGQFELEI